MAVPNLSKEEMAELLDQSFNQDGFKTDTWRSNLAHSFNLKKKEKKQDFHLMLKPSIKEGIERKATELGISFSSLVGEILEQFLNQEEQ